MKTNKNVNFNFFLEMKTLNYRNRHKEISWKGGGGAWGKGGVMTL